MPGGHATGRQPGPDPGMMTTAANGGRISHLRGDLTMHWLWVFLIGLVVGIVAKFLLPGKDPGGFIVTGLLGIAGSLLAGWLGQQLHFYGPDDSAGFIASVIGAIILLLLYRLFTRKRTA